MPTLITRTPEQFVQALAQLGPNARCTVERVGINKVGVIRVSNDISLGAIYSKLSASRRAQEGYEVARVLKGWSDVGGTFFTGFGKEHLASREKLDQPYIFSTKVRDLVDMTPRLADGLRVWELRTLAVHRHLSAETRLRNIDGITSYGSSKSLQEIVQNSRADRNNALWNKRIFSEMSVEDYQRARDLKADVDKEDQEDDWEQIEVTSFESDDVLPNGSRTKELRLPLSEHDKEYLRRTVSEHRRLIATAETNYKAIVAQYRERGTTPPHKELMEAGKRCQEARVRLNNFMSGHKQDLIAINLYEDPRIMHIPAEIAIKTPSQADLNAQHTEYLQREIREKKDNLIRAERHYFDIMDPNAKHGRPITDADRERVTQALNTARNDIVHFMGVFKDDLLKLGLYEEDFGQNQAVGATATPANAPIAHQEIEDGFELYGEDEPEASVQSPATNSLELSDEEEQIAIRNARDRAYARMEGRLPPLGAQNTQVIGVVDIPAEELANAQARDTVIVQQREQALQQQAQIERAEVAQLKESRAEVAQVLANKPADPRVRTGLLDMIRPAKPVVPVDKTNNVPATDPRVAMGSNAIEKKVVDKQIRQRTRNYIWQSSAYLGLNTKIRETGGLFARAMSYEAMAISSRTGQATRDIFARMVESYKGVRGDEMVQRFNGYAREAGGVQMDYADALEIFRVASAQALYQLEVQDRVIAKVVNQFVQGVLDQVKQDVAKSGGDVDTEFDARVAIPVDTMRRLILNQIARHGYQQNDMTLEGAEEVFERAVSEVKKANGISTLKTDV